MAFLNCPICEKRIKTSNKICSTCKNIILYKYSNGKELSEISREYNVEKEIILKIIKSSYGWNSRNKNQAHVYFISDGKYIKIGVTKDLKRRLIALQNANPRTLKIIHSIFTNAPFELERKFHAHFKNKHIRGEWFNISEKRVLEYFSRQEMIDFLKNFSKKRSS
jgi:hypothetical protein